MGDFKTNTDTINTSHVLNFNDIFPMHRSLIHFHVPFSHGVRGPLPDINDTPLPQVVQSYIGKYLLKDNLRNRGAVDHMDAVGEVGTDDIRSVD